MKTQTQVTINIKNLTVTQNLFLDPSGFHIKVFFSSCRVDTKIFKVDSNVFNINQILKIKNIVGNQLEFWLCIPTSNKIIAIGSSLIKNQGTNYIDLKMNNTDFGTLNVDIETKNTPIEKQVFVQPDQELLKRTQDPIQKLRRQQLAKIKAKQQADRLEALRSKKKPAITLTHYDKKDEPFV